MQKSEQENKNEHVFVFLYYYFRISSFFPQHFMFVGLLFCIPECTHRKAGTHQNLTPGGGTTRTIIVIVIIIVEPLPQQNIMFNQYNV